MPQGYAFLGRSVRYQGKKYSNFQIRIDNVILLSIYLQSSLNTFRSAIPKRLVASVMAADYVGILVSTYYSRESK